MVWKKVQKWIFMCFQFSMLNMNLILMDVNLRTEPIWRQATCLRNRQWPGVGSLGEKSGWVGRGGEGGNLKKWWCGRGGWCLKRPQGSNWCTQIVSCPPMRSHMSYGRQPSLYAHQIPRTETWCASSWLPSWNSLGCPIFAKAQASWLCIDK